MPLYEQSSLGTATNKITFNLFTAYPVYRMTRKFVTRRELDEFDIKLPEGTGDADYQSFIGKSYMIIEGTMYPRDKADYDTGRKALRKLSSLDIEQADSASDQGYVPFSWTEYDGYNKQLMVKVMYVDLPESTRTGLKQPFRILCKIKYPVIQGQTSTSTNVGSSNASTSGSSNLPWVLPVNVGLTTYSSNGTIINNGDLPTFPASITIYGPINRPRLTNSTTGEYIEVNTNLATASDSLVITYDQDSVSLTVAGNSVYSSLTSGSTLFKLMSGINNLSLTGQTVGTGAYAVVTAFPAWPLS